MPVKILDLAHHIHGNTSLRASFDLALEGIISRVQAIDSAAGVNDAVNDIRQNKQSLIESIFANISGTHSNLGAGETAKVPADNGDMAPGYRADDPHANALLAERQANPALPLDASGHKMHPADALGTGAASGRTDPAKAAAFGGSGTGAPAADRRDAAFRDPSAQHLASASITDANTGPDGQQSNKTPGQLAAEARIAARAKANASQQNGPHD